jgi:hypothetical protein
MPAWLAPWLIPLALAVGVIATAISTLAGVIVFTAACSIALPALRLRYLKRHPPRAELVKKPFWKF